MAEKRRSGTVMMSESKSAKCETDEEFLSQSGASALLRGALLKLLESRSEDPVGFLAEHFGHLSSEVDDGGSEHQTVIRSLWHLSLAHHSQRSAFNNNVRVAYELLAQGGPRRRCIGGVHGAVYTETLRCLCSEGGLSATTASPLLRRIRCHDYEAVPFELFRQGVLTCSVYTDYIRKSRRLYAAVASAPDRPAERALCQAVLATLQDALETADGGDVGRYLEASTKISPAKLAQAMAEARPPTQQQEGPTMDAQEFEDAAAMLFIARVRMVT